MSHISIFDTQFAKSGALKTNANLVAKYIVNNRHVALFGPDLLQVQQAKTILNTPLNKLYDHISYVNALSLFTVINTALSDDSVPELLTVPDITIDTAQLDNASVLTSLPEFKDKIIVNINQIVRMRSSTNRELRITDINELHGMFVRGALVMSYHGSKNDTWLTPSLCTYIGKSYSMTIGSFIKRFYNLQGSQENVVNTILSLYILGQLSPDAKTLINGCTYLGSRNTIAMIIEGLKDYGDPFNLNLETACKLIADSGPQHMSKFNDTMLIRLASKLSSSYITTYIALEYPPYWVYLLILALSNFKIYIGQLLQQQKLIQEGGEFLRNLDTSKQFFEQMHR